VGLRVYLQAIIVRGLLFPKATMQFTSMSMFGSTCIGMCALDVLFFGLLHRYYEMGDPVQGFHAAHLAR